MRLQRPARPAPQGSFARRRTVSSRPISWAKFLDQLEQLYAPPLRSKRTLTKLRQVLREFVAATGARSTADLTPLAVARFARSIGHQRSATISGKLGYLKAATSLAIDLGVLELNPFASRRRWATAVEEDEAEEPKHHSAEEIARLLAHLKAESSSSWQAARLYALVATFAYTGLRRDEGLKLLLADIDLEQGVIWIRRRRRRGLKTRASEAPVPCPDALLRILAWWLPRAQSEWAFPTLNRKSPWTGGNAASRPLGRLQAEARRVGVAGVTFLSLRRSWATHGESLWNLSELVIQRVLRHADKNTQKHYRKADVANLRRWVEGISFDANVRDRGNGALRKVQTARRDRARR